jgi:membrane fusion protein (multidrug efflux system)
MCDELAWVRRRVARERGALIRRHFFLIAALCVLGLMILAGGLRLAIAGAGGGADQARPGADAQGGRPRAGGGGGQAGGRGAAAISAATVGSHDFVDRIEVLGVAKGRRSVTITSNTTELITAVHFTDGQRVRQGQVLVDLKAQAESADIAEAQARLNLAEITYQRWKKLGDQGIAAKATVDQYAAALDQAKAGLDASKARMGDHVIRAPFAGVVGLSDIAPGALINPGTPIVALDDLAVIRVDFDVPDRYLPVLHEGLPIIARTDSYPREVEHGRIAKIDTRVDQRTRAVKARAEFPNTDGRLKPGMLMRVGVDQGRRQALAVPEAAIQYEGDQAFVFVIAQRGQRMVAEQRQVLAGDDEGGFVEIKSGLQPGEKVVADGINKVSPGQAVRLAGQGGEGAGGSRRGPDRGRPAR